ncbi:MAG TPA: SMP-30/gluconolactonase/LRE family protein [Tepidisphaeraceae bacterium]|nr:SMP-30/gluconolactonase/LRE family protein [Tepidisphaeraceae bacterium]
MVSLLLFAAVASAAQITTLAGTGKAGLSGDNGPATAAELHGPTGLTKGPDGAIYVCDTDNHVIRRIAPDGVITTIAGTGSSGYSGDNGPATKARLNDPYEVRFDKSGNLFFCERQNHCIRKIDVKAGTITTIAGTGKPGFSGDNGPATRALFKEPHSIQFGPDGALYVCDIGNHRIRRIDMTTGIVTTFAGTGEKKPTPDGAPIAGTPLNGPRAIDFDPAGNLWVALREGNAVYKIDPKTKTIRHMAGTGKKGFTGNGGPALNATLNGPKGIAVGPDGAVYLADTESHSIRKIDPTTGTIDLVAGTGQKGDGPDGAPTQCRLSRPHGIHVAPDGALYIGDTESNKIRVIR